MTNGPIFKQKDMSAEMKRADGDSFSFYATYEFSKTRELYKDRIGLVTPRYVGRPRRNT